MYLHRGGSVVDLVDAIASASSENGSEDFQTHRQEVCPWRWRNRVSVITLVGAICTAGVEEHLHYHA